MSTISVVNTKDCIACNTCSSVCPVDAIRVRPEGFAFSDEKCISCGACVVVCPTQCIKIESMKEWYKAYKENKIESFKNEYSEE